LIKKMSNSNQDFSNLSADELKQQLGPSQMHVAIEANDEEGLVNIIKEGVEDINFKLGGETALHYAAFYGRTKMLKFLVEQGKADIKSVNFDTGMTPLHIAATYGRDAIVQYYIAKCPKALNLKNKQGSTPLHLATLCEKTKTVQLLAPQTNKQLIDQNEELPIHIAVRRGLKQIVEILINCGFPIDICDRVYQRTLLHYAVVHDRVSIIELLVSVEPKLINAQDVEGYSALHVAAALKRQRCYQLLLQLGANSGLVNKSGHTAEQITEIDSLREKHADYLEFMEEEPVAASAN